MIADPSTEIKLRSNGSGCSYSIRSIPTCLHHLPMPNRFLSTWLRDRARRPMTVPVIPLKPINPSPIQTASMSGPNSTPAVRSRTQLRPKSTCPHPSSSGFTSESTRRKPKRNLQAIWPSQLMIPRQTSWNAPGLHPCPMLLRRPYNESHTLPPTLRESISTLPTPSVSPSNTYRSLRQSRLRAKNVRTTASTRFQDPNRISTSPRMASVPTPRSMHR